MTATPPVTTKWAYLQDIVNWINNPNTWLYGRWNNPPSAAEGGVDLFSPAGTPVYALGNGQVIAKGLNNVDGRGVITVRTDVPGYGKQDLFYQHIDINSAVNTEPGAIITYGERIGSVTDKGNNSHVELGFNSGWGGPWGSNHPDKWYTDPRPLLKALVLQHPNAAAGGQDAGASSSTANCPDYVSNAPLIGLPLCAIYEALVNFGEHIAVFLLALVLLLVGIQLLRGQSVSNLVTKPAGIITKAAMA